MLLNTYFSISGGREVLLPSEPSKKTPVALPMNAKMTAIVALAAGLAINTQTTMAAAEAFPKTEPGRIEIKTVPAGRLLESASRGDYFDASGRLFNPLFRYIQQNGIAMTTPVEALMSPGKMRFWVAESQVDKAERDADNVKVIDLEARRVVSLGYRGGYSEANFQTARAALINWIKDEGLRIKGEPYAVFWNGPFTPGFLKTFEVHALLDEQPTTR